VAQLLLAEPSIQQLMCWPLRHCIAAASATAQKERQLRSAAATTNKASATASASCCRCCAVAQKSFMAFRRFMDFYGLLWLFMAFTQKYGFYGITTKLTISEFREVIPMQLFKLRLIIFMCKISIPMMKMKRASSKAILHQVFFQLIFRF
jgi:hypothetical protein